MKKIAFCIILIAISLLSFAGCGMNYNAVMYSNAQKWMTDEYLRENRVRAYYLKDDDYVGDEDDWGNYFWDESSPSSRIVIISQQEEIDKNFKETPFEVDFEREIIILYFFGSSGLKDYKLKRIDLEEQTLNIYFKYDKNNPYVKDSVSLYQRCLMIKLDKIEFDTVNFIEQR